MRASPGSCYVGGARTKACGRHHEDHRPRSGTHRHTTIIDDRSAHRAFHSRCGPRASGRPCDSPARSPQFIRVLSAISAPFGLKVCDSRSESAVTTGVRPAPIDSTHGRGRRPAPADRVDLACPTCRRAKTTQPHDEPAQGTPGRTSRRALARTRRRAVWVSHTDRARKNALRRFSTDNGPAPKESATA